MLNASDLVSAISSTYSFVAASCGLVGSNIPVILGDPINATLPVPFGSISKLSLLARVEILLSSSLICATGGSPGPTLTTFCAPKLVTPGIAVIPVPNEFPLSTVTPLILNSLPVARFTCSELVHACDASAGYSAVAPRPSFEYINTLSVVPFNTKPPPSAISSELDPLSPVCASTMYLSSTTSSVCLIVARSPSLITKLPLIVTSPATSNSPPSLTALSIAPSYKSICLLAGSIFIAISCEMPFLTSKINNLFSAAFDSLTLPLSTDKLACDADPTTSPKSLSILSVLVKELAVSFLT